MSPARPTKGEPRAGLRLNVRVAELMGWTWKEVGFYWDKGGESYLVPPEGPRSVYNTTSGSWNWLDRAGKRRVLNDMPDYSGDIAAAWLVVEKMRERGVFIDVDTTSQDYGAVASWEGKDDDDDIWMYGMMHRASAAPLAICLAALEAVQP